MNKIGFFPYTPATQMLHGLAAGIDMLHEEGLDNVFARHDRLAEATRRAVRAWGLEIMCQDPKYYSPTITAVMLPEGHNADAFRSARARHLQHLLWRELRRLRRQVLPHRPPRRHQRRHADRRARHHRDGAGARRHPAQEGRRAGGDGLHRLRACRREARRGGIAQRSRDHRASWPGLCRPSTSVVLGTSSKTWMPGTRPGMTGDAACDG